MVIPKTATSTKKTRLLITSPHEDSSFLDLETPIEEYPDEDLVLSDMEIKNPEGGRDRIKIKTQEEDGVKKKQTTERQVHHSFENKRKKRTKERIFRFHS